jgi:hypothetical protein
MKKYVFILFFLLISAYSHALSQENLPASRVPADTVSVDSTEYELIIFDPGFENWLIGKRPKEYHSQNYYENMNRLYVSEWNYRYFSSKDRGEYDSYIDYDPDINYGLDLNYKLYYYFKYFEETHNTRLYPAFR